MQSETLGYIFAGLALLPIALQIALALGAPLGRYTMGGRFSGRLPDKWRALAVVQALLLAGMAAVVLDHTGGLDLGLPPFLIWPVIGLTLMTLLANALSPSPSERKLWTPVIAVMAAILVWTFFI